MMAVYLIEMMTISKLKLHIHRCCPFTGFAITLKSRKSLKSSITLLTDELV